MNMEKRSAKHCLNESVVNSAHKAAMKKPILNPYIKIERLDLGTPLTLPTTNIKQTDNKARVKCESSEELESSEESYELIIPTKTYQKKYQTNTNSNVVTCVTSSNANQMSDYEKQIQKNLEGRREIFEKFLVPAKRGVLQDRTNTSAAAPKAQKRKWQRRVAAPLTMSLRIRDGTPRKKLNRALDLQMNLISYVQDQSSLFTLGDPKSKHKSIEDKTFFKEMIPIMEKEDKLEKLPANQQDFLNVMKSFSIPEKGVAKVFKTQINCLAWHPNNYKLLVAVGSSDGNVGFWDIDKLEDKYQGVREFNRVHSQKINCINFDKFNPMRLLTSSNDSFVRYFDLLTNVWDKIYSCKDVITCHAQNNRSTLLVSVKGNVSLIDLRTNEVESKIQCFRNGTCTVSLHPQDENLFMTSDRSGEMGIFDMRYTAVNDFAVPVVHFPKAPKRVNGTFFSPITGKYVLTSYADDTLKLYDIQKGQFEPECIKSMHHYNPKVLGAGKLRRFKAVWHPQREDVFIIGSNKQPYRVELYDAPSGTLLHKFKGDSLDSATSINLFHPTAPVFAACNFGKIFIFRS